MKKHPSSHVRNCDDGHDEKGTQHKAFAPTLNDVSLGIVDIPPVPEGVIITTRELESGDVVDGRMSRCHDLHD